MDGSWCGAIFNVQNLLLKYTSIFCGNPLCFHYFTIQVAEIHVVLAAVIRAKTPNY